MIWVAALVQGEPDGQRQRMEKQRRHANKLTRPLGRVDAERAGAGGAADLEASSTRWSAAPSPSPSTRWEADRAYMPVVAPSRVSIPSAGRIDVSFSNSAASIAAGQACRVPNESAATGTCSPSSTRPSTHADASPIWWSSSSGTERTARDRLLAGQPSDEIEGDEPSTEIGLRVGDRPLVADDHQSVGAGCPAERGIGIGRDESERAAVVRGRSLHGLPDVAQLAGRRERQQHVALRAN